VDKPRQVATVALPTPYGDFAGHAYESESGFVHLALVRGDVATGPAVLARLHSECLTGDALGSLRCDCGIQLRSALRAIAAEGRGVLVYATGQEGRGIGLINKLRAYVEQDNGADTVDANLRLGLPVDVRDYGTAAAVLLDLGVRSVRLMTNNPAKVIGLEAAGVHVEQVQPIPIASHTRNNGYLRTKQQRLGHGTATSPLNGWDQPVADVTELLGAIREHPDRPHVVLKYAQTLDGRIATANGDSKWISGEGERAISHALRAACDAVLVGVGTVVTDDPQLTVRMVAGASPVRVVLDSTLRTPPTARVLDDDATTIIFATDQASPERREELRSRQVAVRTVPAGSSGVDLESVLKDLRVDGVRSLLVEGGARVITAMLAAGVADRLIVAVAPTIVGSGTEAVGDLGIATVASGLRLTNRSLHVLADDMVIAWDVVADEQVRRRLREATVDPLG
jgi:3,4-dihydroxy 2-butanone 4-phosphate synthase/GTP cyclohydrolase II